MRIADLVPAPCPPAGNLETHFQGPEGTAHDLPHHNRDRDDQDRKPVPASIRGSISIPIANKEDGAEHVPAPASIRCSTRWISRDSAITAPMMKAPSATL